MVGKQAAWLLGDWLAEPLNTPEYPSVIVLALAS